LVTRHGQLSSFDVGLLLIPQGEKKSIIWFVFNCLDYCISAGFALDINNSYFNDIFQVFYVNKLISPQNPANGFCPLADQ
jgi:hypothetical protein